MEEIIDSIEDAYGEFPGAPETLNDADVIDCHCGEEEFGGISIACL